MATILDQDGELIMLERFLENTASTARALINEIPDSISIRDEARLIDAASSPVSRVAEAILNMPATSPRARAIHKKATDWLDGHFWQGASA